MQKTLFGFIESRIESRDRARALIGFYAALADAPDALECRMGQVAQLQSFIDRSRTRMFDANWWDGLQRCIGDPEELLTERDVVAMRRDRTYWKKSQLHYLNCPKGMMCRCKLHPKEVAYLEWQKREVQREVDNITINVPLIQEQVNALRAIGPLPKEIADRYKLTEDGKPMPIKEVA